MTKYPTGRMHEEAGLLDEVLWSSGRSTGKPTMRQEGMMTMQALLGKLPVEAKKKLVKAEVTTHGQPAPTQAIVIEGAWYGRKLLATVLFRFSAPEGLEITVGLGSDSQVFKGKPGQYKQLGIDAGAWLRKVLLAAKKSKKKSKTEGTEKTMLDKLLSEMREQAGLEEGSGWDDAPKPAGLPVPNYMSSATMKANLAKYNDHNQWILQAMAALDDALKVASALNKHRGSTKAFSKEGKNTLQKGVQAIAKAHGLLSDARDMMPNRS